MALKITKGLVPKAQKVVIYGVEGIGKTTLASQFPDPLFIDTEGSTTHMDVARTDTPTSWRMLLDLVNSVITEKPCKTLIIDTVDWAEQLAIQDICAKHKCDGIEGMGYGKGYTYLAEEFSKFLNMLTGAINAEINVVLTAHSTIKKFEQPDEAGAYDRYELKLQRKTSPLIKEWADALLFCNYKTNVENVAGKAKARGGKVRVMHTTHHACWDAKNRWGLEDTVPMEFASFSQHVLDSADPPPAPAPAKKPRKTKATAPEKSSAPASPPAEDKNTSLPDCWKPVLALMGANNVSESDIQEFVGRKGWYTNETPIKTYPEKLVQAIEKDWEKVYSNILDNTLPF